MAPCNFATPASVIAVDVINDLSTQILEGEFIVFVGSFGCRQCTLIRMSADLLSGGTRERVAIGRAIVHTGRALARNAPEWQLVSA